MGAAEHAERVQVAAQIAELLDSTGLNVAVAESLTGGMVSSALAEAPGASSWFRGAVVAYSSEVKHQVLDVAPGPVVTARAAAAMAKGVRRLLQADVAIALTGAGGPGGQDGQPPGTAFLGLADCWGTVVEHRFFEGRNPADICAATTVAALRLLLCHLSQYTSERLRLSPVHPRRMSAAAGNEQDGRIDPGSDGRAGRRVGRWRASPEEGGEEMADKSQVAHYEVLIEGKAHQWAQDTISVAELRQLGNLPDGVPVMEEDLRTGAERILSEKEILRPVGLDEGKPPTKRVNFRRG
ncbi:MAG: CinA family protein [Pseudonocardiaceae bacterium]